MIVVFLATGFWLTQLEAHGPEDPIPRCVSAAEKHTRACHCDARNRIRLPDLERFVMHRGRCTLEGGLGPPTPRPPLSPPHPPAVRPVI